MPKEVPSELADVTTPFRKNTWLKEKTVEVKSGVIPKLALQDQVVPFIILAKHEQTVWLFAAAVLFLWSWILCRNMQKSITEFITEWKNKGLDCRNLVNQIFLRSTFPDSGF